MMGNLRGFGVEVVELMCTHRGESTLSAAAVVTAGEC